MRNHKRNFLIGASMAALLGLGVSPLPQSNTALAQAPRRHDGAQLRGGSVLAQAAAQWLGTRPDHRLSTDKHDDIRTFIAPSRWKKRSLIATRKQADCCKAAPDVLEFSPAGDLMHHFGKVARP